MNLEARAARVVLRGFDPMAAFTVILVGMGSAQPLMLVLWRALGIDPGAVLAAVAAASLVLAYRCRFRLVVELSGGRLTRAVCGLPWSRQDMGLHPEVVAECGWDADELYLVPEHPRDAEDFLLVLSAPFGGWTSDDMEASAAVAMREIVRVTTPPPDPPKVSPYRARPA